MPFEKGHKKSGGRQKGVQNAKTGQWEALVESLQGEQADKFNAFMGELWNGELKDRAMAADLYLKLLEFHKPKLQRTAITDPEGNALPAPVIQVLHPSQC